MPLILGTAGHIDHGKTSLVKALTGEDTDRLKEEKERGISIDLGFAHFDLPNGQRVGVVDVPGHERFIRNMLAGAHGVDLVLFTVAADDGVMPQTEEHLDILHLLGVERAIFVVTKVDLASEARRLEVDDEIRILTEGTSLAGSPIVPFSFVTGQGLPELRDLIVRMLLEQQDRRSGGYFRLPVDRAFALQGHGLIVTGTALNGEVHVGERVRALPQDQIYRVRSVQVHDQPVEAGTLGQRVALNLAGAERATMTRGDVICHEKLTRTCTQFDAFVELRPSATAGVRSHQRVRVHVATAERIGKVVVFNGQDRMARKESAYCQIALSEAVCALRGDRFVLRDETAQRTLGGGVIVHPWPRRHKRSDVNLGQRLSVLHRGSFADVVTTYMADADVFAVPLDELYQFLNLREEDVEARLAGTAGILAFRFDEERLYSTEAKWNTLRDDVMAALRRYHTARPLAPGMEMEELRVTMKGNVSPKVFRAFVEQLETRKTLVRDGSVLRLPAHTTGTAALDGADQRHAARIRSLLAVDPLSPPDLKQIEADLGAGRSKLLELLALLERERAVVRVASDLYFPAEALDHMKTRVREHFAKTSDLTPAGFRELFGTSRKYTIPLLEYLDREGVTIRAGEVRRLRKRGEESTA